MADTSNLDWQAIRADYENGSSLRALAVKYGVSKSVIGERKYKEQWSEVTRTHAGHRTPDMTTQGVQHRDVNATQKVAMALKLRAQKLTYEEIATRCGYADRASCYNAVQRELQRIVVENVDELRREESYMLDLGHSECWQLFMDKNNKARLFAWDRVLETSKDRRKLLNIDAKPEELNSNVNYIKKIIIVPPGGQSADTNG